MTTFVSTGAATAEIYALSLHGALPMLHWHCLPLISWYVSSFGIIAESVVGWLTEFESEDWLLDENDDVCFYWRRYR